jgi:lysophospholipase L1-like esterase
MISEGRRSGALSVPAVCFLALSVPVVAAEPTADPDSPAKNRFENQIQRFEEQDAEQPPPEDAALFVGSSSIRMWDLEKYFPDFEVINRGYGGSTIADSIHFAERIVIPYKPRVIVFYAGDNDIALGKTPKQVFEDYKTFVRKIRGALPEVRIVFIAIKPSIARWQLVDKMRDANRSIHAFTKKHDFLEYVDIETPMIGTDGKPRPELFIEDGLHLSDKGYVLWSSLVKPNLEPPKKAAKEPEGE